MSDLFKRMWEELNDYITYGSSVVRIDMADPNKNLDLCRACGTQRDRHNGHNTGCLSPPSGKAADPNSSNDGE